MQNHSELLNKKKFENEKRAIENLNHIKMLDPLGQAWQSGSALAAYTVGCATVNKHRLCGSLLISPKQFFDSRITLFLYVLSVLRFRKRDYRILKNYQKFDLLN